MEEKFDLKFAPVPKFRSVGAENYISRFLHMLISNLTPEIPKSVVHNVLSFIVSFLSIR